MDEPLLSNDGGVVVVGVGAIERGYVLACPRDHVMSLAEISDPRDYLELVAAAVTRLEARIGPVLIFEHGGCGSDEVESQCIAHAHLHVWAIKQRLTLEVPGAPRGYDSMASFFEDADRWRGAPYLLAGTPGSLYVAADVRVPQFFRRQVAEGLGHPDEWDYAAFWFEENMRATIDLMRGTE